MNLKWGSPSLRNLKNGLFGNFFGNFLAIFVNLLASSDFSKKMKLTFSLLRFWLKSTCRTFLFQQSLNFVFCKSLLPFQLCGFIWLEGIVLRFLLLQNFFATYVGLEQVPTSIHCTKCCYKIKVIFLGLNAVVGHEAVSMLKFALLNGITFGQAISDYNKWMITLFELSFPLNDASFSKHDLIKLLKLVTLSG